MFTEDRSAEVVVDAMADRTPERLREVLTAVVRHLHDLVKEVELTGDEWAAAVDFLTRTGQTCDDTRQEVVLLSDVLGVSMLVETLNHRSIDGATESTVLGPFHVVSSPVRSLGDTIALDGQGTPCVVAGRVTGPDGEPVAAAQIDVWQANAEGFYDVQQPGVQPARNLRGLFTADRDGRYWFRSIVPRWYPIPTDGPVGELLRATGRHPNRPAHLHLLVSAPGYEALTTHVFTADSPYLDGDPVFGVKRSLVREVVEVDDLAEAQRLGVDNPHRKLAFDIRLRRT